jgi:hypothetical protein
MPIASVFVDSLVALLSQLLGSEPALLAIGSVVGYGLLFFFKTFKSRKRLKLVCDLAYEAVDFIKDKTPTKIDDKVALALKGVCDMLGRDLSPKEEQLAKAQFEARHDYEAMRKATAEELANKLVAQVKTQIAEQK